MTVEKKIINTEEKNLILPNSVFSSPIRMTIMLILCAHKKAGFTELQKLLHVTPGKLDHHVRKLEAESYILTQRAFLHTRPLTFVKLTKKGEEMFKEYISTLRDLLNKINI
ncbi:MAG: transcriptional regulator [Candidatus Hodarchaeota archaeon]